MSGKELALVDLQMTSRKDIFSLMIQLVTCKNIINSGGVYPLLVINRRQLQEKKNVSNTSSREKDI